MNNYSSRIRGFTLVEILASIAIVSVLAAISFGVFTGVQEKMATSRASTEIAAMSSALAQYRSVYGSYPQNDAYSATLNTRLLRGLVGVSYPDGQNIPTAEVSHSFISLDAFDIRADADSDAEVFETEPTSADLANLNILDPWGNPYLYFYDAIRGASTTHSGGPTSWRNPTFVLYSLGPDGAGTVPSELSSGGTGIITPEGIRESSVDNLDNVFAEF